MTDYEFTLEDRIAKIQAIDKEYNLQDNAYISYSGGKDSTILSYLVDLALPDNKIPRVYINTGIEYNDIVAFVKEKTNIDSRFIIINSGVNIKKMLEENGYPFKSKEHSMRVYQFNTDHNGNYIKKYITGYDVKGKKSSFVCPQRLLYQFKEKGKYNYSDKCCYNLKKQPAKRWAKENNKTIVLTGMRAEEGGNRARLGCTIFKGDKLNHFHPLIVVSEEWENEFIEKNNIELCRLYYPPFNFKRTGCKGCPYSLDLQEQLDIMDTYLPNEKKQCEILWKPVYDEYRRLGYRLRKQKERQMTIEDFIDGTDKHI